MDMVPRFRFAPSPTGTPHIGNLHTALFSWALARALGGDFVLRLEDTDPDRNTPAAAQASPTSSQSRPSTVKERTPAWLLISSAAYIFRFGMRLSPRAVRAVKYFSWRRMLRSPLAST